MALHKIKAATYEKARRGELRVNQRRPDGGGLYLRLTKAGAAGWVFRYQAGGRERFMGGGSLQDISLRDAHHWAAEQRRIIAQGADPVTVRRQQRATGETFWSVAERTLATVEAGGTATKSKRDWRSTLERFAKPKLGSRPVASIKRRDVLEVLQPIWPKKYVTASRLRTRIEAVFDAALAEELIEANPARWADLRGSLGRFVAKPALAHPSIPWRDMPGFLVELRKRTDIAARALEFLILTASRSAEALSTPDKKCVGFPE